MIAIIDYDAGNIKSVEKALLSMGETPVLTPGVAGLGILEGKIVRIPEGPGLKIPHMGWNSLNVREGASLFKGLEKEPYVYFVHSYYLQAKDPKIVAATAEYGVTIHASVEKENVFACQFHPEKSSKTGLAILKNFLAQRREG